LLAKAPFMPWRSGEKPGAAVIIGDWPMSPPGSSSPCATVGAVDRCIAATYGIWRLPSRAMFDQSHTVIFPNDDIFVEVAFPGLPLAGTRPIE
jgi:hypothetical protein